VAISHSGLFDVKTHKRNHQSMLAAALASCSVIALPMLAALPLGTAVAAPALQLAEDGSGQVLLFPYYTVNSENQTLISIVNSTAQGKATRLLFREAQNSRVVSELSIYLAPYDVWTAAVFGFPGTNGAANLVTTDNSCTVPALKTSTTLPRLSNGNRYLPFSNSAYSGAGNDAGADDLARTREGHFELIELGEVTNASFGTLTAISQQANGVPPACSNLIGAWEPGGYWLSNPAADMAPPRGGLFGTAYIIDALAGTMQAVAADAIENFSGSILNGPPGRGQPTLAFANTGTSDPLIGANVFVDGAPVTLEYPVSQAVDAVSAVLMADQIHNEFVTSASVGGASEWVVTFPTKHFYTDVAGAAAIAPFPSVFADGIGAGIAAGAPAAIGIDAWNRQGLKLDCIPPYDYHGCIVGVPPPSPPLALNWASNVVVFNREVQQPEPSPILGSLLNIEFYLFDTVDGGAHGEGAFRISFWDQGTTTQHLMRPDNRGRRMRGLPVQGFWVASYTNGQLTPGVLSNYSDAVRHQRNTSVQLPAQ
jgi:hypothetical protein